MNFTCSLSKICPTLHSALQHRWLIICALKSEHLNIYRNFNHLRLKWKDENFSVGLTADLLPDWWVLGFKPGTCKKPVHRVWVTHVSGYGMGSHRNQYTADAAYRFQHLLVIIICSPKALRHLALNQHLKMCPVCCDHRDESGGQIGPEHTPTHGVCS